MEKDLTPGLIVQSPHQVTRGQLTMLRCIRIFSGAHKSGWATGRDRSRRLSHQKCAGHALLGTPTLVASIQRGPKAAQFQSKHRSNSHRVTGFSLEFAMLLTDNQLVMY